MSIWPSATDDPSFALVYYIVLVSLVDSRANKIGKEIRVYNEIKS